MNTHRAKQLVTATIPPEPLDSLSFRCRSMTKQLSTLFLASLMSVVAVPYASAASISLGEMIVNGGFGTNLNSWTTAGTVNRRLATNTINTSGGNAGFNSFFTTPFAALGDASGVVGDTPGAGISSLSQTFTLPGTITEGAVDSYDLVINFSTVFDGRDDGDTPLGADLFSATLDGIALFSQVSTGFPDGSPSASSLNNQLVNNPFGATILGLAPGSYTLTFILNESNASDTTTGGVTNTAAGIDAVSVLATANLVQLPEPGSLALAGAALALSGILTRRGRRETSRGTR